MNGFQIWTVERGWWRSTDAKGRLRNKGHQSAASVSPLAVFGSSVTPLFLLHRQEDLTVLPSSPK